MRSVSVKARVLSLLKKQSPDYISGEEISRLLGVSRTAVWKHIRKLRNSDYQIESRARTGYRLVRAPDRLEDHELAALLQTCLIGNHLVYRETVDSTNELAKKLAHQGTAEGTVVVAETQTGGKGRMGRIWYSPAGQGLWFSVILKPPLAPPDIPGLNLVWAVAVAKTIQEFTGLAAGIKWPNDILINDRKVAGVLTEMNAEIDKVNYLIVGIGVNVNLDSKTIPPHLAGTVTSLTEQKGSRVARLELLAALLNNLDLLYQEFLAGKFNTIMSAWRQMSVTLHRWVRIKSQNGVEEGIAFDLDESGALLLMKKDGSVKKILYGDVSLR